MSVDISVGVAADIAVDTAVGFAIHIAVDIAVRDHLGVPWTLRYTVLLAVACRAYLKQT